MAAQFKTTKLFPARELALWIARAEADLFQHRFPDKQDCGVRIGHGGALGQAADETDVVADDAFKGNPAGSSFGLNLIFSFCSMREYFLWRMIVESNL